jgi:hypothetical protein
MEKIAKPRARNSGARREIARIREAKRTVAQILRNENGWKRIIDRVGCDDPDPGQEIKRRREEVGDDTRRALEELPDSIG